MSLQFVRNRLESSDKRVEQFIDTNIQDWSEQVLLEPAQVKAIQLGLSSNAANGMSIEKIGFMKAIMVWEYRGEKGQPLHKFLENGFGKGGYDINAIGKDFGGADFLSWVDKSGKRIFRKKVRHPGFKGYKIMRTTWEEKKEQLTQRIALEVNNFMEANRL